MKVALFSMLDKYKLLGIRERLLILLSLLALVYLVCNFGIMQSTRKAIEDQRAVEQNLVKSIQQSRAELKVFESAVRKDPNAQMRIELVALKNKLEQLDQNLSSLSVGLIHADTLPMILHDILVNNKKLKLENLKTLPAQEINLVNDGVHANTLNQQAGNLDKKVLTQAVNDTDAAALEKRILDRELEEEGITSIRLYKYGVSMGLKGSFQDVAEYIQLLEEGNWRFYWEELSYDVEVYPSANITMKVYTLSNERSVFDGTF